MAETRRRGDGGQGSGIGGQGSGAAKPGTRHPSPRRPVAGRVELSEEEAHSTAVRLLNRDGVPYLVAGAFALGHYTGIWRHTKDLDLFLQPTDVPVALDALATAGFRTMVLDAHWLAKATWREWVVDLIFGFGDWRALIDRTWLERGKLASAYGMPVRVISPEDLIWTKAYVAHRERFDGADIAHVILATGADLDWRHLLWRFGPDWELLLHYLLLFAFIYPTEARTRARTGARTERACVPPWLWDELLGRFEASLSQVPDGATGDEPVCRGTLLDRFSYVADVEEWGYWDERTRWAIRHGFTPRDIVRNRREAARMVAEGQVRPGEIA
ncbi:MAG: nucleotidyltransferase [Chloroflexi bacterium]|nr:nucleotidyltransferase [Chloroflexota bacterium]